MTDNLALWKQVCETEPEQTKGFSRAGGFKGTAIKPYWLMKRATEVFGLCGIGWGWEELENKMVAGVWCSKVRLWYALTDESFAGTPSSQSLGSRGQIEQWGQTVMEGKNKNGDFVDEEAPKKAVTDAVTKCLSYLGFGGDVHMGLFDDSKYVESIRKAQTARAAKDRYSEIKAALAESDDPAATWQEYRAEINEFRAIDPQFYADLTETAKKRKAELLAKEQETASFGQGFANTK